MQSYILVVVGLYNEKCSFLSPECAKEMAGVGGRRCERKVRPWQYLGKIPWVLSRARRDLDEVGAHRRLSPRPGNTAASYHASPRQIVSLFPFSL